MPPLNLCSPSSWERQRSACRLPISPFPLNVPVSPGSSQQLYLPWDNRQQNSRLIRSWADGLVSRNLSCGFMLRVK
ncbi:hypothetical protein ACJMK2_013165, partial [Sinanodonta woodiana]